MNTLLEILKSLGIPSDNKSMSLQGIIDSVLKKNHPDIPEYSDISNQKLSVIDDSKKATITLLEPNLPPFFSNIIVISSDEKEVLTQVMFKKVTLKKKDQISGITISANFVVPQDCKIIQNNKEAFEKVNADVQVEGINDPCLAILLELIRTTKGIVEVTIDRGNEAETITVYEIFSLVQMN